MPKAENFSRNLPDENRLLIAAVDGFGGHVRAHFNPKEIQLDKKVNWVEQKAKAHNEPYYEFTAGGPRTLTMELLFDRFEIKDGTVDPELQTLQRMAIALDPKGKTEDQRRPPILLISNGPVGDFQCVLESLVIKVTMFDRRGRAVRATANVTFKELRVKGAKIERPNAAWSASRAKKDEGKMWQSATQDDVDEARRQQIKREQDQAESIRQQKAATIRAQQAARDAE
jgi:hypothetical protein